MGAAWLAARAGMRGQARALAALTLLVGIIGGSVLVALAGSRRVETAFDRLTDATGSSNLEISVEEPVDASVLEPLRDLDGVESASLGAFVGAAPVEADLVPFRDAIAIATIGRFGADVNGGRALAGRNLDDAAMEVVLNRAMAELTGLQPGDRTELVTIRPETALASLTGEGDIDRADGVDATAATARLAERFDIAAAIAAPSTIDNLDELGLLPSVLALVVAALGCAAIGYGLASSVRRSQRELATVRAIGASRAMLVRSVLAQAAVLVVVGLLAGIPLGITAGRSAYEVVARSTGAVAVLIVPLAGIALVAAASLLLAVLLGLPPSRRVARTRAATFLRVD